MLETQQSAKKKRKNKAEKSIIDANGKYVAWSFKDFGCSVV